MRVAIYARVSTNNAQDPSMQTRELREYRGWSVTGEYVDRGVSGGKESRPAMNRLLNAIHERKCGVVLVWKMDRWARSLRNLVNSLADLEARGVAFVSLRDNVDLTTPSGRLMVQIIGAMAEFERALIQERVKAGLRNARAKGMRIGRPRVEVDGRQVMALREAGVSWSKICERTGLSKGTAQRAHHNQKVASRPPKTFAPLPLWMFEPSLTSTELLRFSSWPDLHGFLYVTGCRLLGCRRGLSSPQVLVVRQISDSAIGRLIAVPESMRAKKPSR